MFPDDFVKTSIISIAESYLTFLFHDYTTILHPPEKGYLVPGLPKASLVRISLIPPNLARINFRLFPRQGEVGFSSFCVISRDPEEIEQNQ